MEQREAAALDVVRRSLLGGAVLAVAAGLAGPARALGEQVIVIAELDAAEGKEAALRAVLVPFATGAKSEPGCLQYVLMEDDKQPGRFLTFEVWKDKAAIDAHMKTPQLTAVAPKLTPLLAKPFTQTFLTALT